MPSLGQALSFSRTWGYWGWHRQGLWVPGLASTLCNCASSTLQWLGRGSRVWVHVLLQNTAPDLEQWSITWGSWMPCHKCTKDHKVSFPGGTRAERASSLLLPLLCALSQLAAGIRWAFAD